MSKKGPVSLLERAAAKFNVAITPFLEEVDSALLARQAITGPEDYQMLLINALCNYCALKGQTSGVDVQAFARGDPRYIEPLIKQMPRGMCSALSTPAEEKDNFPDPKVMLGVTTTQSMFACPVCHCRETSWTDVQSRGGDEGFNVKLTCKKCGHKWTKRG